MADSPAFTLTIEQVEESPLFSPLTTEYPQMCVVCPERVLKHEVMARVHLDSNVSMSGARSAKRRSGEEVQREDVRCRL